MSAARGLKFGLIAYQLSASKQVLSPVKTRISVPGGFPYEAFNGSAFVKPWSILRMIESSRGMSFTPFEDGESFMDVALLYLDYSIFIASAKTDVAPEMYDPLIKKGPLSIDVELVQLGSKSFNMQTTVFLKGLDSPLCTNNVQSVLVSNKTRRPAEPPEWLSKKVRKYIGESGTPVRLSPIDTSHPPLATDYSVSVPVSDVDPYLHMNWANCVKYCYEAYMSQYLQNNKVDLKGNQEIMRNAKSFSQSYIRESSIGDVLNVHMWQHKDNDNLFQFKLLKDSNVANECNIEFYPQDV